MAEVITAGWIFVSKIGKKKSNGRKIYIFCLGKPPCFDQQHLSVNAMIFGTCRRIVEPIGF
jgi:hypothetical protein